ncbi:MAG: cryptochrome/photolyase family protein [Patescibacteria group bacterium]
MKSALILYPHQLYPAHDLPKVETVVLVEEPLLFGMDRIRPVKMHKQKLILHRASMRRYAEEVLWPAGYKTEYLDLDVFMSSEDVLERVSKVEQLYVIDPTDELLTKQILEARRKRTDLPNLTFLSNPNFYLKEQEIRQYFSERHKHPFEEFYQWQRERFNVLIGEDYKPVGGKWSYEDDKPRKLPADAVLPSFGVFGDNKYVADAVDWVNQHYPDNPGSDEFIWPTNHAEARAWLDDFVTNRLDDYATYLNTIDERSPWLYHSLLASSLNIGLLSPQEIVQAALDRHKKKEVPLASLESFIRQVLGWREFTRGEYLHKTASLRAQNVFNSHRKLTSAWYNGTTGLPPLDDVIKKLQRHGYAHQHEQRVIAGNLMLLCEIQPEQMMRWFTELSLDTYDWTLVPNVYGMNMFTSGTSDNIPPVATSQDILEVSNYQHGDWSDIWDGLFWRFIEKHHALLAKNPHMRSTVARLSSLDADHKRIISYRAEDFLNQHTAI